MKQLPDIQLPGGFFWRSVTLSNSLETPNEILLARVAEGDQQALEELFALHRGFVRRIVDARLEPQLRPRVDPSDIVQETLYYASRRIDDFLENCPVSFRFWLRRKVLQQLEDTRRRHYALKRDVRRESPVGNLSAMSLAEPLFGERASEIIRKKELLAEVESAIEELSEIDREVLLLLYAEGLSNGEVAEILNLGPNAIRQRHGRALRKLATALKRHEI